MGSVLKALEVPESYFSCIELADNDWNSVAVEDVAESKISNLRLVCFKLAAAAIASFEGALSYSVLIISSFC